jgi:adenine-specific DNA-methyltransferase
VLVQLPEALSEDNPNQRAAAAFCTSIGKAQNLVEITKERLRRSAASVRAANPGTSTDLGFRVFKLDSSNIRPWDPAARDLDNALLDSVEHVKPERGEQDVLFELMLKLGINLAAPVTTRIVAGTIVWCADGGRLFCCLAKSIPHADVSTIADDIIAWHTELAPSRDTTVIFRDSAFAQDATKANLAARLKQRGLMTVRSI